ncbi:uncharacterized protein LOC116667324 isoform X2 [Camelus ferus]|uniref:Uncharacterized protein LOC116667324 isoform X2 n=1 Tax=Camelus ferus TaxID=419612 RepID=A0A8B8U1C8_CAMFR|nr:uncharacterized protein LOC116667324 isoform X2 [Camelus ferus]
MSASICPSVPGSLHIQLEKFSVPDCALFHLHLRTSLEVLARIIPTVQLGRHTGLDTHQDFPRMENRTQHTGRDRTWSMENPAPPPCRRRRCPTTAAEPRTR